MTNTVTDTATLTHRSAIALHGSGSSDGSSASSGSSVSVDVDVTYANSSVDVRSGFSGNHTVVHVRTKYPRTYVTGTHGHSAESFAASLVALARRHAQVEERIDQLQLLVGMSWVAGGVNHRLSDITIGVSGKSDCELFVQVMQQSEADTEAGAEKWRRFAVIRRTYSAVADIPSNDDIIEMLLTLTQAPSPATVDSPETARAASISDGKSDFAAQVHSILSSSQPSQSQVR